MQGANGGSAAVAASTIMSSSNSESMKKKTMTMTTMMMMMMTTTTGIALTAATATDATCESASSAATAAAAVMVEPAEMEQQERAKAFLQTFNGEITKVKKLTHPEYVKSLPEFALLSRTTKSNQEEVNALLDYVISKLFSSSNGKLDPRKKVRELMNEHAAVLQKIEQARASIPSARDKPLMGGISSAPYFKTKEYYVQEIATLQKHADALLGEASHIKWQFWNDLNSRGIQVSEESVDDMFDPSDETDETFFRCCLVHNYAIGLLKLLDNELTNQPESSRTIESIIEFCGVQYAMFSLLLRALDDYVNLVHQIQLPKLTAIKEETREIITQFKDYSKRGMPTVAEGIAENQDLLLCVQEYEQFLKEHVAWVRELRKETQQTTEIAWLHLVRRREGGSKKKNIVMHMCCVCCVCVCACECVVCGVYVERW